MFSYIFLSILISFSLSVLGDPYHQLIENDNMPEVLRGYVTSHEWSQIGRNERLKLLEEVRKVGQLLNSYHERLQEETEEYRKWEQQIAQQEDKWIEHENEKYLQEQELLNKRKEV